MKRRITPFMAAVAPLAVALAAAGCGASLAASGNPSGPTGSAAPPSVTTPTPGSATVGIASTALGRILSDGQGRTLYLFEKDQAGQSACSGACATAWPPLLTKGKPVAGNGVQESLLGTTRRADGTTQVTYAGHPLYGFVQDSGPGQTNGEDSQAFGAGWYVVSPAGAKIEPDDS